MAIEKHMFLKKTTENEQICMMRSQPKRPSHPSRWPITQVIYKGASDEQCGKKSLITGKGKTQYLECIDVIQS